VLWPSTVSRRVGAEFDTSGAPNRVRKVSKRVHRRTSCEPHLLVANQVFDETAIKPTAPKATNNIQVSQPPRSTIPNLRPQGTRALIQPTTLNTVTRGRRWRCSPPTRPNMAWGTYEEKFEAYVATVRGLLELERDRERRSKYIDFVDIYGGMTDVVRLRHGVFDGALRWR